MSLCNFSSAQSMDNFTIIDNLFVNEFLPSAPEYCVKVYIYGLHLCSRADSLDNTIENMSLVLNLQQSDIIDAFTYWQSVGLVQILTTDPIEIKYLPVKANSGSMKKFNAPRYEKFNTEVQALLKTRVVYPNEFNEYYLLIENANFEQEAIILIIKYCTMIKGTDIGYPYILQVARDFAHRDIKTAKAIDAVLLEQEKSSTEIMEVLKALGLKRKEADIDERNLYLKWIQNYGFAHGVIINVAKKYKNKGGMIKLDAMLTKYYEQKLFSIAEIETYSQERENMFTLAREITSQIGIYYQNLESVVDMYISDWLSKGYDNSTLKEIAKYCFKKSIRNLDGMNTVILKFYKLGIISLKAIEEYFGEVIQTDSQIQQILDACNISRNVNTWDRDSYRTWTYSWNLSLDIILFACTKAKDKTQPIQYLNKILSSLHENNISTLEQAKKNIENYASGSNTTITKPQFETRVYDKKDLDALFDNLDDVEV